MKNNKNQLYIILVVIVAIFGISLSLYFHFNNNEHEKVSQNDESTVKIEDKESVQDYFTKVLKSDDENFVTSRYKEIVDFIFNDKEINGVTFDELKDEIKIKIISLSISIDSKIEKYFPDYKNKLKDGVNSIYSNFKDKINTLYFDLVIKMCDNNKELCDKAKDSYKNIKNEIVVNFDKLKELGKDNYQQILDFINDLKDR